MSKQSTLQRINSHEKLHKKIHKIEERVKRLEKILISCTGALITAMGFLIYTLITHLSS